jgi:inner membrane protein
MPSAFGHALIGSALGASFRARGAVIAAAAFCSAAPDLDVAAFRLGIPYAAPLGHRGAAHSLAFAVLLGGAAALALRAVLRGAARPPLASTFALLAIATASHGLFDALTDGGLGVAFFWPFDETRYFLPVRPIAVSPLAVGRFFSARGAEVLASELRWLGLPALALWLGSRVARPRAR